MNEPPQDLRKRITEAEEMLRQAQLNVRDTLASEYSHLVPVDSCYCEDCVLDRKITEFLK